MWIGHLLTLVFDSRKQKMADRTRVTGFARLYQALKTLQAEIDDMMPDFEEQMEILT